MPGDKILKNGDILNIDVTPIKDGYHGDTSRMFYVGEPSIQARRLCEITYQAMWRGIRTVKPGAHLGDIGYAIQSFVEALGYSVVREFCGHGIGSKFHEEPQVLHYGKPHSGLKLEAGMIFTIEPMINAGKAAIKQLGDGWTVVTKDHSLSAQWEHTVLVTETGFEVLTLSARFAAYTSPVSLCKTQPKSARACAQHASHFNRILRIIRNRSASCTPTPDWWTSICAWYGRCSPCLANWRWWRWAVTGAANCIPIPI